MRHEQNTWRWPQLRSFGLVEAASVLLRREPGEDDEDEDEDEDDEEGGEDDDEDADEEGDGYSE